MKTFTELKAILPPPLKNSTRPVAEAIELQNYIVSIPKAYHELLTAYQDGSIDNFLWILSPNSTNRNLNFETSLYFIKSYATLKHEFPSDYPRPIYPSEDSFFPWAVTDNGDTFSWPITPDKTISEVIVHSSDQATEEIFKMDPVEFLISLLSKEISSRILPEQFPPDSSVHIFSPVDNLRHRSTFSE